MTTHDKKEEMRKEFKSAVCLIPDQELWGPIQAIREKHDKHVKRWMPHINILYPFLNPTCDHEIQEQLTTDALRELGVTQFDIMFKQFRYFVHGKKSATVWLDPEVEDVAAITRLQSALVTLFPECDDLGGGSPKADQAGTSGGVTKEYVPHLSVGQWKGEGGAKMAVANLSQDWEPIVWHVRELFVIRRDGFADPFTKRMTITLPE